jgi:hypothetical protein
VLAGKEAVLKSIAVGGLTAATAARRQEGRMRDRRGRQGIQHGSSPINSRIAVCTESKSDTEY